MKRKKKKVKEPFWKRIRTPELQSLAAHVGKIFDNAKPNDILDLVAGLTAFYAGFNAGRLAKVDLAGSLGLGGSGVMALQLARSPNIVAGASGTAFLASLGLINVWNPLSEIVGTPVADLTNALRAAQGLKPLEKGTRIEPAIGIGQFGFGFP